MLFVLQAVHLPVIHAQRGMHARLGLHQLAHLDRIAQQARECCLPVRPAHSVIELASLSLSLVRLVHIVHRLVYPHRRLLALLGPTAPQAAVHPPPVLQALCARQEACSSRRHVRLARSAR
jgi:hypothetical protein